MIVMELTAVAETVGVLQPALHHPPLEHFSTTVAAVHDGDCWNEEHVTLADVGKAVVGVVAFWLLYIEVWILWGAFA